VADAIEWLLNVTENIETTKSRGSNMEKVGLIGCGYWGSKILTALDRLPHIETIVSTKSGKVSLDTILNDPQIKNVFIATPVQTHYELCRLALEAGKNVMCEKNFTETFEQALDLYELSSNNGLSIFVDYTYTLNPNLKNNVIPPGAHIAVLFHQDGRIDEEDTLSMLGSHALSVAYTLGNLYGADLINSYATSHYSIQSYIFPGTVRMDLWCWRRSPSKTRQVFINNKIIELDFENGIDIMVDKFLGGADNTDMALEVAHRLDEAREHNESPNC